MMRRPTRATRSAPLCPYPPLFRSHFLAVASVDRLGILPHDPVGSLRAVVLATENGVVAAAAVDQVGALVAVDHVVAVVAGNRVRAETADDVLGEIGRAHV